jgi:hypothetical protein
MQLQVMNLLILKQVEKESRYIVGAESVDSAFD